MAMSVSFNDQQFPLQESHRVIRKLRYPIGFFLKRKKKTNLGNPMFTPNQSYNVVRSPFRLGNPFYEGTSKQLDNTTRHDDCNVFRIRCYSYLSSMPNRKPWRLGFK